LPNIDRQMIEELSTKTSFQVDIAEKVYRLSDLLRELNEIDSINKHLVLKGGTAINFLFFDFPRLSVDIDLDYIGSVEKEVMIRDRKHIKDILQRLYKKQGYTVEVREPYALLQSMLSYSNSAGNKDRIKVEINFFNRVPVFDAMERKFVDIFGFKDFNALTLVPEDLFGRKIRALMTRATARDLYDAYQLFSNKINIDTNLLRKCFIFYLCCHGDPRNINLDILDEITPLDIKTTLLPLLRKGEKIHLEDLLKPVKPILKDFLSFNDEENEFVTQLFDNKIYNPDILFKNIKYNKKIKEHPGIQWRIQNM
jgi:predicted nucleotidyltransferase component of viral defense system